MLEVLEGVHCVPRAMKVLEVVLYALEMLEVSSVCWMLCAVCYSVCKKLWRVYSGLLEAVEVMCCVCCSAVHG